MSEEALKVAKEIVDQFPVDEGFDAKTCLIEEIAEALDRFHLMSKEPDYIYDPDNWEVTYPWDDRYDLIESLEIHYDFESVKQLKTLVYGPSKYVVVVVLSWDDTGDPDETEVQWFDSEAGAKEALAASLAKRPKTEP